MHNVHRGPPCPCRAHGATISLSLAPSRYYSQDGSRFMIDTFPACDVLCEETTTTTSVPSVRRPPRFALQNVHAS